MMSAGTGIPAQGPVMRLAVGRVVPAALVLLTCLGAYALSWSHLVIVWRSGTFFDTDDAMRMVQVRDWLAGQGWYDLTAHRLSPPAGLAMHWSRIVDVPLAVLIQGFALVATPMQAERLARIAFPLACQALLILAFVRAALVLCGPAAFGPALIVILLNGFEFGQFMAGRVDHHAPQIVLLMATVGAAAAGLRRDRERDGWLCGAAIALSLGISLENLPFIAVIGAVVAGAWLTDGATTRFPRAFGIALAVSTSLVFFATVAPARLGTVANDALSAPQALLAVIGGSGLGLGASLLPRTAPARWRVGVLGGTGLLAAGLVAWLCPGFPVSPYAGIDPVVRTYWLDHVTEARPLLADVRAHPGNLAIMVLPMLAGLAASLLAMRREPGARPAWVMLALLIATGVIGACWELRVTTTTLPLAALGGTWAVTQAAFRPRQGLLRWAPLRVALVLVPVCPVLCVLLPLPNSPPREIEARAAAQRCRDAEAFVPLATLPPGLVFAPIDLGAHLLAHTASSVLAAPYHRNNAGNRAVIDGFLAPSVAARTLVAATGAKTLVTCRGDTLMAAMAAAVPDSLAAHLVAGDAPSWLHPLLLAGTPLQAYRIE